MTPVSPHTELVRAGAAVGAEPATVTPEGGRTDAAVADLAARLHELWKTPRGVYGFVSTVDHKKLALRYIVTAFVFLLLGGLEAGAMRVQLSRPENSFVGPDMYDQLFTMHGSTMMFLFAVPIMTAMGLYLVPLMIGTRDLAFPRLNAFGYWTYLIGGLLLYASFLVRIPALGMDGGPDAGWFAYVPLSGPEYDPSRRMDVWSQMITFTEISALSSAAAIIVTVFKQRAPGMSLNRVPIFVWGSTVTAFMIMFAMPVIATASMYLAMDRGIGTHFFNQAEGGDALLWQHMFWFFGHPEVYIIFIPATGMVSAIIPTFARRPMFGYTAVVLSLIGTAFAAFGLWVHHMFATPLPQLGQSFFSAASMMIAIPSGIQMFCWLATIWTGRPWFATPMLFVCGFIVLFMIGGVTGVMVASVPFDLQAHDTYFVVAHFHYVLIGGGVFPLWGAFYYWFPKFTGRMLSERLGRWNFWLFFLGMNLTFFPMHFLGLAGMPRRVYTYLGETGWGPLNRLASLGAVVIVASVLVFIANVLTSLRRGRVAGADPWGADTLEWATTSPPPGYNFLHVPVVQGRNALWDAADPMPVVTGLRADRREVLLTTMLDAEPDSRYHMAGHTIAPFLAALAVGVGFIGALFTPWGIVWGAALVFVPFLMWGWPRGGKKEPELVEVPR